MSYKIIVSPVASKNIEDAVEYYILKASKKVALDFLNDYRKTYKALKLIRCISIIMRITVFYHLKNFHT